MKNARIFILSCFFFCELVILSHWLTQHFIRFFSLCSSFNCWFWFFFRLHTYSKHLLIRRWWLNSSSIFHLDRKENMRKMMYKQNRRDERKSLNKRISSYQSSSTWNTPQLEIWITSTGRWLIVLIRSSLSNVSKPSTTRPKATKRLFIHWHVSDKVT